MKATKLTNKHQHNQDQSFANERHFNSLTIEWNDRYRFDTIRIERLKNDFELSFLNVPNRYDVRYFAAASDSSLRRALSCEPLAAPTICAAIAFNRSVHDQTTCCFYWKFLLFLSSILWHTLFLDDFVYHFSVFDESKKVPATRLSHESERISIPEASCCSENGSVGINVEYLWNTHRHISGKTWFRLESSLFNCTETLLSYSNS